jgi:hypothetical protein
MKIDRKKKMENLRFMTPISPPFQISPLCKIKFLILVVSFALPPPPPSGGISQATPMMAVVTKPQRNGSRYVGKYSSFESLFSIGAFRVKTLKIKKIRQILMKFTLQLIIELHCNNE